MSDGLRDTMMEDHIRSMIEDKIRNKAEKIDQNKDRADFLSLEKRVAALEAWRQFQAKEMDTRPKRAQTVVEAWRKHCLCGGKGICSWCINGEIEPMFRREYMCSWVKGTDPPEATAGTKSDRNLPGPSVAQQDTRAKVTGHHRYKPSPWCTECGVGAGHAWSCSKWPVGVTEHMTTGSGSSGRSQVQK